MFIFANGAVKSGSTWLFHIVRELTGFGPPPVHYANPKWTSHPVYSIDPTKLASFLRDGEAATTNVLSKNHFNARQDRDLLLAHPNVCVVNIRRDIRDVLVSAFYHRQNGQSEQRNFSTYYWTNGRRLAHKVLDYQIIWHVHSSRYCCLTYETLLADFAGEAGRLAHFLGLATTAADLEHVRQATSPAALNAQYPFSDFNRFRRGQIGDWQSHFDAAMVADMTQIVRRSRNPLHRMALVGPAALRRLCRRWR